MGYQLSEDELEMWIERLKSYNSNDIEKFDEDINAFVEQDFINPPKKNEFLLKNVLGLDKKSKIPINATTVIY